MSYEQALNELTDLLRKGAVRNQEDLESAKLRTTKRFNLSQLPSNSAILGRFNESERKDFEDLLRVKRARSASGVVVVAVMSNPAACPHGRCIYCPGGPLNGTPQSYTGREPAAMRGAQYGYDPYLQVRARLDQLKEIGHPIHKVEVIVMGGTFPSRPANYQRDFITKLLGALNGVESTDLKEAITLAESAPLRNVGLAVETRPDFCREEHVDLMLEYGTTRVEIGLQTTFPDILESIGRKHSIQDSIEAIRISKDAGLKVGVHIMPGLPGSSYRRDIDVFRTLVSDQRYRPDMMKIYPTLVLSGTELYETWKRGNYVPLDDGTTVELIAEALGMMPRWMRVMRVQRDIPASLILGGPRKGNLRELALRRLMAEGRTCVEIRCREAGLALAKNWQDHGDLTLQEYEYDASEGKEYFISYESVDGALLFGYLRMRIPSQQAHRPEVRYCRCAIVRELKVVGRPAPFGRRAEGSFQHMGLGHALMRRAETKACDLGMEKLLVMSAVGARDYYYKLGYVPEGPYVSKVFES